MNEHFKKGATFGVFLALCLVLGSELFGTDVMEQQFNRYSYQVLHLNLSGLSRAIFGLIS